MSHPRRFWAKLALAALALTVIVAVAWVAFLPLIVRGRVRALTGCPVDAQVISVNPFGASARLEAFRLRNPASFPVPDFIDLKLVDVSVKLLSLRAEVIEVPHAVFDLEKITIVTARDGTTNAEYLREQVNRARGPTADAPAASAETQKFHIGDLVIRIGAVELVDYSRGAAPVRRKIALNAEHHFKDVTDARVVVRPLIADLARADASGILGSLSGLLPGPFRRALGGALGGAGGILQEPVRKAGDTLKKLIDSLPVGQ